MAGTCSNLTIEHRSNNQWKQDLNTSKIQHKQKGISKKEKKSYCGWVVGHFNGLTQYADNLYVGYFRIQCFISALPIVKQFLRQKALFATKKL